MQSSVEAYQLENERLCQQLHDARSSIDTRYTSQDGLLQILTQENQRLNQQVHCRVSQVASLEQQNKQILHQSQRYQHELHAAHAEHRRLVQELETTRRTINLTSHETMELQRLASKTRNDAVAYQEMASELQDERQTLIQTMNELRGRVEELEGEVIPKLDVRQQLASEEIRKLVKEKAQLVTRLNEANARLGYTDTSIGNGNSSGQTIEATTTTPTDTTMLSRSMEHDKENNGSSNTNYPNQNLPVINGVPQRSNDTNKIVSTPKMVQMGGLASPSSSRTKTTNVPPVQEFHQLDLSGS